MGMNPEEQREGNHNQDTPHDLRECTLKSGHALAMWSFSSVATLCLVGR